MWKEIEGSLILLLHPAINKIENQNKIIIKYTISRKFCKECEIFERIKCLQYLKIEKINVGYIKF